jgi:hypothetical protein
MKDSHIYIRMNDPKVVKTYIKMIRELDIDTVNKLFDNIKEQANDHYRFSDIQAIYNDRLEHNKE